MNWFNLAALWIVGAVVGASLSPMIKSPSAERANDYGTPVDATAPTPSHVQVRKRCSIAALGVAPWLTPGRPMGTVWEFDTLAALAEMGVPQATARKVIERMRSGDPDEIADFDDYQGVGSAGGRYLPWVSMTFRSAGKPVVCHNARLALTRKHRPEPAAVWHVDGYSLAVFRACGNVARVLRAPPGWTPFLPLPPRVADGNPGAPLPLPEAGPGILPPPPVYPPGVAPLPHQEGPGTVRDVPEPSGIALLAVALAALIALRWSR